MKQDFNSKDVFQLVTFKLGQEEFAINILKVQEIIRRIDFTRVPGTPDFVEGVINMVAEKTFRKIAAPELLAEVAERTVYVNGVKVKNAEPKVAA